MILTSRSQGYMHTQLISHVNSWSTVMKNQGEIRFYDKDVENVVDICPGAINGDVLVTYYPHNEEGKIFQFLNETQDLCSYLLNFIEKLSKADPFNRRKFSIDLYNLKEVVEADFRLSFIKDLSKNSLFIFDNKDKTVGFPNLFVKAKALSQASEEPSIFRVQLSSSYAIAPAIDKQTILGKQFVYRLINSWISGRFVAEIPGISAIDFPTNPKRLNINPSLKTDALTKFASELNKDLHFKNGKVVDSTIEPAIEEDVPTFHMEEAKERILESFKDTHSVYLSDLLEFGVEKTIKLISADKVVPLVIDFNGILKRGYIMDGVVYGILHDKDTDWNMMTGESDSLFVSCTEETVPHGTFLN